MRLEEIKSKTAVHCVTSEQIKFLIDKLKKPIAWLRPMPVWVLIDGTNISRVHESFDSGMTGKEYALEEGYECIECSDLMEGTIHISAEEIVPILTEICKTFSDKENCEGCPLNELEHVANGNECPFTFKDYGKAVDICRKWKSSHMKKRYKVRFTTYKEYEVEAENEEEARNIGKREYCSYHSDPWDNCNITRVR